MGFRREPVRGLRRWVAAVAVIPGGCGGDAATQVLCEPEVEVVADLGSAGDSISVMSGGPLVQVAPIPGGWVVLEPQRYALRYDAAGTLEGRLGREGGGPGEITNPRTLTLGPGDSLWIADTQGRVVVFDRDGSAARTIEGGGRTIDGFTPSGYPYKLAVAYTMGPDGAVAEMSLYIRRWTDPDDPAQEDRIGRGAAAEQGARQSSAAFGSLAAAESDTTFLVAGNWAEDGGPAREMPAAPGVMRLTPISQEPWLSADELHSSGQRLDLPVDPHMMPRAIGRTGSGSGYWMLAGVRKVSEAEMREREEGLDGSPLNQPLFKNAIYRGMVWQVARDGSVIGAAAFDAFPDGLAGPDHFFSVTEDSTSGFRGVRIYRLRECQPAGAPSTY